MATSFFYIYVMATSFFYIYIYIYITFTNWRSVQSFFRTQFLPLSERRRTSVRKWKYKSQGRDTWRTSPMISSRNRSLDPLSSPERQIMISRAWSPLRKSSRSSQVSPRCLPGVSQVSPWCLPGVSRVPGVSQLSPWFLINYLSIGWARDLWPLNLFVGRGAHPCCKLNFPSILPLIRGL